MVYKSFAPQTPVIKHLSLHFFVRFIFLLFVIFLFMYINNIDYSHFSSHFLSTHPQYMYCTWINVIYIAYLLIGIDNSSENTKEKPLKKKRMLCFLLGTKQKRTRKKKCTIIIRLKINCVKKKKKKLCSEMKNKSIKIPHNRYNCNLIFVFPFLILCVCVV